jgi:putative ABC transport system permease protein
MEGGASADRRITSIMSLLPLSYAVRNLFRVPARLAQLVLGAGVVILLLMLASALSTGMDQVLRASGSERNVIVLGSGSEESVERSEIAASVPSLIAASVPGIKTVLGRPAVSPEIHYSGPLQAESGVSRQTLYRGVTPAALLVHPEVRLVSGRFPRAGEVMVGKLAAHKLDLPEHELAPGKSIMIGGTPAMIVGVFQAPGTVMEAEVWADLGDMLAIGQRDTISCAVVRLDEATFDDVEVFTLQRLDLELSAMQESEYYVKLSAFYKPLRAMTWVTTVLVAAGAIFGGLNTLYAAFASRVKEMATLQAIGYSRSALLLSLLQECALATLLGAFVAAAVALWLEITPRVLATGVLGGLALAVVGALPPAWTCLKPALPTALRAS